MRADEDKRLGEFMDAFVSRSGSASEERKAAEAISVSTVTDPSEVDVHTVMGQSTSFDKADGQHLSDFDATSHR